MYNSCVWSHLHCCKLSEGLVFKTKSQQEISMGFRNTLGSLPWCATVETINIHAWQTSEINSNKLSGLQLPQGAKPSAMRSWSLKVKLQWTDRRESFISLMPKESCSKLGCLKIGRNQSKSFSFMCILQAFLTTIKIDCLVNWYKEPTYSVNSSHIANLYFFVLYSLKGHDHPENSDYLLNTNETKKSSDYQNLCRWSTILIELVSCTWLIVLCEIIHVD